MKPIWLGHGHRPDARLVRLMVAATVAGCGVAPGHRSLSTSTLRHAGELTDITYINPLPGDHLWDRVGACMTAEAARHGIAVHIVGPPGGDVDTQQMENMLSQAVADHAQAIATWSAGAPAAFDALFAQARAQGAVVATLLSPSAGEQNFEVGVDTAGEARIEIAAIARLPGRQRVGMIMQYPTGSADTGAIEALRDEVGKHGNVTLADLAFDGGAFSNDVTIATTMLTAHPAINVLVNYSGFPGVVTAIKERHLVGRVTALISSDFPNAATGYINAGLIAGVVYIDGCRTGRIAADRLLDVWNGRPVARFYDNGTRVVGGAEFKRLVARGAL